MRECSEASRLFRSKSSMSSLRDFAKQFVGIPYKLGSFNPAEGLDCATFILKFFEKYDNFSLDIDFPENVFETYKTDKLSKIYEIYIKKFTDLTPYPCNLFPLDLLIFRERGRTSEHVGIYLGDGQFIHCSEFGVQIHKLSLCKSHLIYVGKFKDGVRHG